MSLFVTLLLLFMFVLLVLAGLGVPDLPRLRYGWMGLACGALAWILTHLPG